MGDVLGGLPLPPIGPPNRRPATLTPGQEDLAANPHGELLAGNDERAVPESGVKTPDGPIESTTKAPVGNPSAPLRTSSELQTPPRPPDVFVRGQIDLGPTEVSPRVVSLDFHGVVGNKIGGSPVTGDGFDFGATRLTQFESLELFPPALRSDFKGVAKSPFGIKVPTAARLEGQESTLFRQYQVIPYDLLKRAPSVFLFLNATVGKYAPSEVRKQADKRGVDLQRVVTGLVLDPPANPVTIAGLVVEHQLEADRTATVKQADQFGISSEPLQHVAGKFAKTVLSGSPQAINSMLTDPQTFFGAQIWSKLSRDNQSFFGDGTKARKATGMLARGGLSAQGVAWLAGKSEITDHADQGRGDQRKPRADASELVQQKAFFDGWRTSLIRGIKESADQKADRPSGPPIVEAVGSSDVGSSRALYDAQRQAVCLEAIHSCPDNVQVFTSGLILTAAPEGNLLEIALRHPKDRWEVLKDLAPPVVVGLEPARVRLVALRSGMVFPTHDRFFVSRDRNTIYFQIEKRSIAGRILVASNLLLEVDIDQHLVGILIWQLLAARSPSPLDRKAWISGLAEAKPIREME